MVDKVEVSPLAGNLIAKLEKKELHWQIKLMAHTIHGISVSGSSQCILELKKLGHKNFYLDNKERMQALLSSALRLKDIHSHAYSKSPLNLSL